MTKLFQRSILLFQIHKEILLPFRSSFSFGCCDLREKTQFRIATSLLTRWEYVLKNAFSVFHVFDLVNWLSSFIPEHEVVHAEQRSLIRVVHRLYSILSHTSCRNLTVNFSSWRRFLMLHFITFYAKFQAGCCEAFAVLVAEYPPSVYKFGWQCDSCYETVVGNRYGL